MLGTVKRTFRSVYLSIFSSTIIIIVSSRKSSGVEHFCWKMSVRCEIIHNIWSLNTVIGCLFVYISNGVNRYKVHMYMSCLQLCTKTTMATLFFLEVLFKFSFLSQAPFLLQDYKRLFEFSILWALVCGRSWATVSFVSFSFLQMVLLQTDTLPK